VNSSDLNGINAYFVFIKIIFMKKIFTLLLILISISTVSIAQSIIFSENFNYPTAVTGDSIGGGLGTNTAFGDPAWKKHSGTATGGRCVKYVSTPLTYTGYSGSGIGGSASFQHTVGSADINGYLGQSISTGSVYAAFMLRVDSTGGGTAANCDYSLHFADLYGAVSISNFRNRLFICEGSTPLTKFKIGISKGSSSTLTAAQITAGALAPVFDATEYNVGSTYLCILKYTFNTGSTTDDAMSLFVFSGSLPLVEPTPNVTLTDAAFSDLTQIQSFCIRQGSIGRTLAAIGGIRVFTTWDAATINALPAQSLNLSVTKNENGKASLLWNVKNEVNLEGYSIEKSSDAKNFTNIGFIAAKNAASANYTFVDAISTGVSYYRLKITDKDGSFKYSQVVAVNSKQSVKLDIFPNPVVNSATLSHTKAIENAVVKIITVDGKNIITQNIQVGATQSSIDVSKLIKGNYVIVFENDGVRTSLQFVKQ
jgi:hypothetical protein